MTRVDNEARIYSGIFSATLFHENGSKIEITEGRFDVNLNTLKNLYVYGKVRVVKLFLLTRLNS